jgi:hypothetical protein
MAVAQYYDPYKDWREKQFAHGRDIGEAAGRYEMEKEARHQDVAEAGANYRTQLAQTGETERTRMAGDVQTDIAQMGNATHRYGVDAQAGVAKMNNATHREQFGMTDTEYDPNSPLANKNRTESESDKTALPYFVQGLKDHAEYNSLVNRGLRKKLGISDSDSFNIGSTSPTNPQPSSRVQPEERFPYSASVSANQNPNPNTVAKPRGYDSNIPFANFGDAFGKELYDRTNKFTPQQDPFSAATENIGAFGRVAVPTAFTLASLLAMRGRGKGVAKPMSDVRKSYVPGKYQDTRKAPFDSYDFWGR